MINNMKLRKIRMNEDALEDDESFYYVFVIEPNYRGEMNYIVIDHPDQLPDLTFERMHAKSFISLSISH